MNRPTKNYQIREATPLDQQVIVEFNRRLALETEHLELTAERLEAGVREVLRNRSRGNYFVAERDGIVVGQAMHTWEWSDWRNGEIWWLQSVYVAPEHRGAGVFRLLWSYIESRARQRTDVVGLRLYVEQSNRSAQATYKRLGMTETGYVVMESLFVPNSLPESRS